MNGVDICCFYFCWLRHGRGIIFEKVEKDKRDLLILWKKSSLYRTSCRPENPLVSKENVGNSSPSSKKMWDNAVIFSSGEESCVDTSSLSTCTFSSSSSSWSNSSSSSSSLQNTHKFQSASIHRINNVHRNFGIERLF